VFTPFTNAPFDRRPNFAQGLGLSAGALVADAARRLEVSHDAGGPLQFNIPTKGAGKYVQAMMEVLRDNRDTPGRVGVSADPQPRLR